MGLWGRFAKWFNRSAAGAAFPEGTDICNCGVDLGVQLPRTDLLKREGFAPDSKEYRMHLYGAALYWHMATTPKERAIEANPDMLRGLEVLEVGCMRGGGARWLAEVAGPKRYVAIDNVPEHIDRCKSLHSPVPGLEYRLVDALDIHEAFEAESFDVILGVQAVAQFADIRRFVHGAYEVLRPGGRLLLCDAMVRDNLKKLLDALDEVGFELVLEADLSRAVHAVGHCPIPKGISYLRIVARKEE